MDPVLCLLPSPLTGPAVWRPVERELASGGAEVAVLPPPSQTPRTSSEVLDWFRAGVPADRDVVLVPHSNAGWYVPALTAQRHVTGYVFVDAVLPPPDGQAPMISAEFYDMIAAKAGPDGILPPWTGWWDEDLASLFPSAEVREEVERELPRLPLSYFAEQLSIPSGWDTRPGAYLAFGEAYAAELADAKGRGWPTRIRPGEHLHMLIDPVLVAADITSLLP